MLQCYMLRLIRCQWILFHIYLFARRYTEQPTALTISFIPLLHPKTMHARFFEEKSRINRWAKYNEKENQWTTELHVQRWKREEWKQSRTLTLYQIYTLFIIVPHIRILIFFCFGFFSVCGVCVRREPKKDWMKQNSTEYLKKFQKSRELHLLVTFYSFHIITILRAREYTIKMTFWIDGMCTVHCAPCAGVLSHVYKTYIYHFIHWLLLLLIKKGKRRKIVEKFWFQKLIRQHIYILPRKISCNVRCPLNTIHYTYYMYRYIV